MQGLNAALCKPWRQECYTREEPVSQPELTWSVCQLPLTSIHKWAAGGKIGRAHRGLQGEPEQLWAALLSTLPR